MLKRLMFLFLISGVAIGCATSRNTRPGFLKNYNYFTESRRYPGMFVDAENLAKLSGYNKYILDPAVFGFENRDKRELVSQDVRQEIAKFFHDEIVKNLQDKYQVVDVPGAGVLRIRLAVVDMESIKPYLNDILLEKFSQNGVKGASMEAEVVDSASAERILAVIDTRKESEWDISEGLSEWGYAKEICAEWAKRLKEHLDIGYKDTAVAVSDSPAIVTDNSVNTK